MSDTNIISDHSDTKTPSYLPSYDEQKRLTPIQAIRAKCWDCANGSRREIRLCNITHCSLWAYRMGRRPKDARLLQ